MYESYFGLNDKPFKLTPDPRFFYASSNHKKAMSYLHYGFERGDGFVVVTGPSGTGKTAVARNFIDALDSSTAAIQISTASLSSYDLISMVALSYELPVEGLTKPELLNRLESFFYQLYQQNKRALIIVDEAQHLTHDRLEELRILSNFQLNNIPLVQVFLFGQDELETVLRSPEMEQFRQRIIASCKLKILNIKEIQDYIEYRLTTAGWQGSPALDREIYFSIEQQTSGVPRKINLLMDRVLLYSYLSETTFINKSVIKEVLLDMRNELSTSQIKKTAVTPRDSMNDDLQFNGQQEAKHPADLQRRDFASRMAKPHDSGEYREVNRHAGDEPDRNTINRMASSVNMDDRISTENKPEPPNQEERSADRDLDSLSVKQANIHADIERVLRTLDLVSDVLDKEIVRKLATMQHFDKMIIKKRRQAAMHNDTEQSEENILNDVDVGKW